MERTGVGVLTPQGEQQKPQAGYPGFGAFLRSGNEIAKAAYDRGILPNSEEFKAFLNTDPQALEIQKKYGFVGGYNPTQLGNLNRIYEGVHLKNLNRADVKQQQATATQQAFDTARQFGENLPGYISQEVGGLRKSLSEQLAGAQSQIRQQSNQRGMLYSGQRQKKEGEAGNLAAQQFTTGAADIATGAQKTAEDLSARASALKRAGTGAQQNYSDVVNRAKEARQAASAELQNKYASLIGSGVGEYFGGKK